MFTPHEALSILLATPYLGSVKTRLLIEHFGSPSNVLDQKKEALNDLSGIHRATKEAWGWWINDHHWKENLDYAAQMGTQLIAYTDPNYPAALLTLSDYPLLLYVQGTLKSCDNKSLAVIGTRCATHYGLNQAKKISRELALHGFTIISGLARGIDTEAHRGALDSGRTIAVIGSGLAHLYPRENCTLAKEISEKGAVISEYPMKTPPDRRYFPQRNRIVAGMSQGVLLIEAPMSSGAMITMEKGEKQGRALFALPGRVDLNTFEGNHKLLKQGKAQFVEGSRDILEHFDSLIPYSKMETLPEQKIQNIDKEELKLLNTLPQDEISIEEICRLTKLPISKLSILLMSLVMKQMLDELPGKLYRKCM